MIYKGYNADRTKHVMGWKDVIAQMSTGREWCRLRGKECRPSFFGEVCPDSPQRPVGELCPYCGTYWESMP